MTRQTVADDYIWSAHARLQMRRRGVTTEQVLDALNDPRLAQVSATTGNLCRRHTYPDGRTLKVWVTPGTRGKPTITSTAWEGEDD